MSPYTTPRAVRARKGSEEREREPGSEAIGRSSTVRSFGRDPAHLYEVLTKSPRPPNVTFRRTSAPLMPRMVVSDVRRIVGRLMRLIGPEPEDWVLDVLVTAAILMVTARVWSWFMHG